jgi:hydrogenase expression/formation protein HypE
VLLSGDVGRHGIAVLSVRKGLEFQSPIESDCAPLTPLVTALAEAGIDVHCLRDATRGGLATAVNELAIDAGVSIELTERSIPVSDEVAGACELLGLDPLYVACEGRMVVFVAEAEVRRSLDALGKSASRIGTVGTGPAGVVTLRTGMGSNRLLDLLSGEQLPRIC